MQTLQMSNAAYLYATNDRVSRLGGAGGGGGGGGVGRTSGGAVGGGITIGGCVVGGVGGNTRLEPRCCAVSLRRVATRRSICRESSTSSSSAVSSSADISAVSGSCTIIGSCKPSASFDIAAACSSVSIGGSSNPLITYVPPKKPLHGSRGSVPERKTSTTLGPHAGCQSSPLAASTSTIRTPDGGGISPCTCGARRMNVAHIGTAASPDDIRSGVPSSNPTHTAVSRSGA